MIVFDLRCASGHVFEAWFGSSAAFDDQVARSMVRCAVCGDTAVEKAVMAPRLGAGSGSPDREEPATADARAKAFVARVAAAQAKALEGSTWVGDRFARRARAIHDGLEPPATIHGRATPSEARALAEEGVPVAPLPLPVVPPEQRN